jgi:hypothetical protein
MASTNGNTNGTNGHTNGVNEHSGASIASIEDFTNTEFDYLICGGGT